MNTLSNNWATLPPGHFPAHSKGTVPHRQTTQPEPTTTRSVEEPKAGANAAKSFDVDALVENLWGFMKGRLAEAQAAGASENEMNKMWRAAEKGLEKGFNDAKDVLRSMGKMTEPLNERIDEAYNRLTETLENRDLSAPAPTTGTASEQAAPTPASRSISLYQYQEQTFELDVTTLEGDKIRIRVQNQQESGAQSLKGEGWSSFQWGRQDSNAFSLQIEGHLSDAERADLDRLLGDVNTLANEFYDGDLNVAWQQAQALDIDGTSLASMDLSMREVEAKGAAVYQQAQPGHRTLPQGLNPLREYAQQLLAAQKDWQDSLGSRDGLPISLINHPRNEGVLGQFAQKLFRH